MDIALHVQLIDLGHSEQEVSGGREVVVGLGYQGGYRAEGIKAVGDIN
jgi:hypothetical protein